MKGRIALGIRECAEKNSAFQTLKFFYDHRDAFLQSAKNSGKKVVGRLGYGVCDELIRAAGLESVAVSPYGRNKHEIADTYLEYAFTEKGKLLFSALAAGEPDSLPDYLAVADSEDVMNRLYYYLRELQREEPERKIPELYLVDWLFSRHMAVQNWNVKALERFRTALEGWSGNRITESALREAIAFSNRKIAAAQKLMQLRNCAAPRLTGCEALVIFGAGDYMDREEYADCLDRLASEAESWPEAEGAKLFFCGSTQPDILAYSLIEAQGFVICGEDHDNGDRAYERMIRTDLEPLQALVDCYLMRNPTAQKGLVQERVDALLAGVKAADAAGVVFYTDRYDEAGSWDTPSQQAALDSLGIPYALFVKMAYPPEADAEFTAALAALKSQTGG